MTQFAVAPVQDHIYTELVWAFELKNKPITTNMDSGIYQPGYKRRTPAVLSLADALTAVFVAVWCFALYFLFISTVEREYIVHNVRINFVCLNTENLLCSSYGERRLLQTDCMFKSV